jgi:hypothetical protein
MLEEENQMALFEIAGAPLLQEPRETKQTPLSSASPAPAKAGTPPPTRNRAPANSAKPARAVSAPALSQRGKLPAAATAAAKKVSGLVPVGDVRLTANIRQDLHLKLKIASAHRRTTIGEIIEELITSHL